MKSSYFELPRTNRYQPRVKVHKDAVDHYGMPKVDFNKLFLLYNQEVGLSPWNFPVLKIYRKVASERGYTIPFGRNIYLNAYTRELLGPGTIRLSDAEVLAHESFHYADLRQRSVRYVGEEAAFVALIGGAAAAPMILLSVAMITRTVVAGAAALGVGAAYTLLDRDNRLNPKERRAYEFGRNRFLQKLYADTITFPDFKYSGKAVMKSASKRIEPTLARSIQ